MIHRNSSYLVLSVILKHIEKWIENYLFAKNLVKSNEIPQYNLDELVIGLTIGSISAKLYSFAKLHKPEILIRPIILVT